MTTASLLKALADASCGAYGVTVDQTIVFWNRAAERILGYSSQDVLGRRCFEVVGGLAPGALSPQCLQGCPSLRYMRAGLVPAAARLHLLCADGTRTWVSLNAMVVTGIIQDAPLLLHLFESEGETEDAAAAAGLLRETLAAGGAEIISDHPEIPAPHLDAPSLTQREREVLRLVALGRDTLEIAAELGISRHTVRNHIRNLRQKLKANTKLDAVVTGIRLGILPISSLSP